MPDAAHPPPARLAPGDRMPVLSARTRVNAQFKIDTLAGRWIVLGVIGSTAAPGNAARLTAVAAATGVFDDTRASLFLISQDREDEADGRLPDRLPGQRAVFDGDLAVAAALGAVAAVDGGQPAVAPMWIVVDPGLTVRRVIPFRPDGGDTADLLALLDSAPAPETWLGYEVPAPVLIMPDVFEPAFCDHLIGLYEAEGGELSGLSGKLSRLT